MGRLTHRTAPGCTYFVTTKTWGNRSLFQAPETADIVVEVLLRHRSAGAYRLHEFVLMPDHLHLLLTPGPAATLEKAMQLIKGGSSYEIHKRRGHRMEIWQPGFQEWTVRDAQDFRTKAEYMRRNPVEANLVATPEDWPHSSARFGFDLDEWPLTLASGAKACQGASLNVGAKAPTP
jgi:putative transposase